MKTVPVKRQLALNRFLVWVACVAGTVHAGFSFYWAFGGQWLLDTVGQWAVQLSGEAPLAAGIALVIIAAVKLLAAAIPVAVAYGRLPWRRFWRTVSWTGGLLLILYGGLNTMVSGAVLAGIIRPEGGYDRNAMIGHAWLWDPLFFIWGVALALSLWFSRRTDRTPARRPT